MFALVEFNNPITILFVITVRKSIVRDDKIDAV